MHSQSFALRRQLDEDGWKAFLINCAEAMDMTPTAKAGQSGIIRLRAREVWMTVFQPIIESFLVVDSGQIMTARICSSSLAANLPQRS